jgi:hypothetical protein
MLLPHIIAKRKTLCHHHFPGRALMLHSAATKRRRNQELNLSCLLTYCGRTSSFAGSGSGSDNNKPVVVVIVTCVFVETESLLGVDDSPYSDLKSKGCTVTTNPHIVCDWNQGMSLCNYGGRQYQGSRYVMTIHTYITFYHT